MTSKTLSGIAVAVGILAANAWIVPAAQAQGGMMGPGYGPGMMYGPGYGPGRGGPGMRGYYGPGMMGGCAGFGVDGERAGATFVDGRIAFLKAELGITDAQKAAWDAYADALRRNLQGMQSMWQAMRTVFEASTPVERLDAHLGVMEGRLAALKEVKPALAGIYAVLSPEQKKKADEVITAMGCMM